MENFFFFFFPLPGEKPFDTIEDLVQDGLITLYMEANNEEIMKECTDNLAFREMMEAGDPVVHLDLKIWMQHVNRVVRCYSEVLNQIIFIYLFAFLATTLVAIFLQYGMAIPIGLIFTTLYLIPAFRTLQTIQSTGEGKGGGYEQGGEKI